MARVRRGRAPLATVAAASGAAGVAFALALFGQHHNLYSNAFDLAFFDQVVWNTSQGRWFDNSFVRYNFLGQHVQPVLLLYAAAYTLAPTVGWLLATQAAAAAAAAVPLYLLAARWLRSRWAAALVAAAYLLSASLHRAVLFDFHPEVLGPLMLFTAAALLAAGRPAWGAIVFALLFLLKEEAALVGAGFAWLLWLRSHRRLGAVVLTVSLAYFLVTSALMAAVRGGPGDLQQRYGYLGPDPLAVVAGLAARPEPAAEHLWQPPVLDGLAGMLGRLGLLPLVSPLSLGAAPLALAHLLSRHPEQSALTLHYGVLPFALLFLASVDGARRAARWRPLWRRLGRRAPVAAAGLLLAASSLGFLLHSPLGLAFDPSRYLPGSHASAAHAVLALVPPGVAVSAQSGLAPHLAHRAAIYEFPGIHEARVVVIDRKGWMSSYSQLGGYHRVLGALPAMGFVLVAAEDGVELYCLEARCG